MYETDEALGKIEELLKQERGAISTFNTATLREIAEKKNILLDELRAALPQGTPQAKQRLSGLLMQASANHALLQDTIGILSSSLGLSTASTYDSRAKLRQRTSRRIEHSI
jgi:flagellar biosynthesis/type III secretory pathway chaperone